MARKPLTRRTLTKRQIDKLRRVVAAIGGLRAAAREARIGREPLTRALAGEEIRGGTMVAIEALIAKGEEEAKPGLENDDDFTAGEIENMRRGAR